MNRTNKEPTQEQLVERIKNRLDCDVMRFEFGHYHRYLTKENIGQFLSMQDAIAVLPTWQKESWDEGGLIDLLEKHIKSAYDYANREKEIETLRSIGQISAIAWLLGEEELSDKIFSTHTNCYGKNIFAMVADRFLIDKSRWDNGKRVEMPEETGPVINPDGTVTLPVPEEIQAQMRQAKIDQAKARRDAEAHEAYEREHGEGSVQKLIEKGKKVLEEWKEHTKKTDPELHLDGMGIADRAWHLATSAKKN